MAYTNCHFETHHYFIMIDFFIQDENL